MRADESGLDTSSYSIVLDPEADQARRERTARRLNLRLNPAFRLAGFWLIAIAIGLHNRYILHAFSPEQYLRVVLIFGLYPLVAWGAAWLFHDRTRHFPLLLLSADTVLLALAIYESGGENSRLFFVPLFRVIDQTHTTFRRALAFGALALGSYAILILWLAFGEGRPISWSAEGVKMMMLAGGIFYTALTAKTSEAHKQTIREAVTLARDSLAALQRSMQRNSRILESAAEGIVGFDVDGRITFANSRAAKTIGWQPEELIGKPAHDLAAHSRPDGSLCDGAGCVLGAALLSGKEERGENAGFFRQDGSRVPVEYSSAPMFEDGRLAGAVFSFRDISERLRLQDELIAARDAAEIASHSKSQFLANMSHELRTPLNAIIGYSQMLQEEGSAETLPDLQKIEQAGTKLLALINDVLDLAKLDAGRISLSSEDLDVGTLAFELGSSLRPKCEAKQNRLTVRAPEEPLRISGDSGRLRQLLLNLLDNANKFTERGDVALEIRRDDGAIAFDVRDTGVGMTAEQMQKLFKPFTQADGSATRRYGGSGLGLAISSRLCSLMGGEISVTSESGKGSTFTVRLLVKSEGPTV